MMRLVSNKSRRFVEAHTETKGRVNVRMNEMKKGSTSVTLNSLREVSIFLCYRRRDGSWFAEWLYGRLNNFEYLDRDGHRCILRAYYDNTAPGVADWKSLHFPSLQTSRALLVISTPGLAKDFSRRGQPDWCYEELRWWVNSRESAPIVVDTTGEGDRWMPELLTKKWPNINRIALMQSEAEFAVQSGNKDYEERIRQRIVGAVCELEHQTLFEDLERSRLQQKKLKFALGSLIILFIISIFLAYYSNERRKEALEQKALAIDLLTRIVDISSDGKNDSATSDHSIVLLVDEIIRRRDETKFVVIGLEVLERWGPQKISTVHTVIYERLFLQLRSIKDEEVNYRIKMLRKKIEAQQNSTTQFNPKPLKESANTPR